MKARGTLKSMEFINRQPKEAGFSLIEALIVIMVMSVVSGMALLNIGAVLPGMGANTAMQQTVAQLRRGRELAIAQRRNIQLSFPSANQIQLTRYEVPTGTTVLSTITLEGKNAFLLISGVPDTPDAFGNGSAISFSGPASWMFLSNGTLVDSGANPINGSIFLGQASKSDTARAVTILGATGRIRDYRWVKNAWVH
jgi:prepilin-type N-terminal cleavage/methylation domain-containing protein